MANHHRSPVSIHTAEHGEVGYNARHEPNDLRGNDLGSANALEATNPNRWKNSLESILRYS